MLNKRVRVLLFVLEIVSRNLVVPLLAKMGHSESSSAKNKSQKMLDRVRSLFNKYLGGG